jgi:hypothetical protein
MGEIICSRIACTVSIEHPCGDEERSFESLVEPLRAILVPVATSVSNPNFQQGAQEFNYIKAYLISSQNTMSRHGGAAIADHGSLGSQQNPGPVMVCNPVFNHFSPGLLRHDNYIDRYAQDSHQPPEY